MRQGGRSSIARAAAVLVAVFCLISLAAERTAAEQTQRGTLVSALDGELRPLALPRDHLAPVALRLEGRLRTSEDSLLSRVTKLEIGLPSQGVLSTRGLPICPPELLRDTKMAEALASCGRALVGSGALSAVIPLPGQDPFLVHARLLAFNARIGSRRALLLHAATLNPPTSSVLPLVVRRGSGRFATALVGRVSAALGPWPRLQRFEITLFRRYRYRGARRSYLSASCPIPQALTAGFFSFARASYSFAGGGQIATAIARGCRAL